MASSFTVNTLQVNFESVLSMEHEGMVKMFRSLAASGLRGFLGMVITKSVIAEAFQLPTEGMVGFTDLPSKAVAEMKMVFFGTDVPFRPSNKKKEMKVEFRLLHDIVAKELCAKARSFDVVTSAKLEIMVAISAGLKVNWGIQTLVAMVHTPGIKSQGFVVPLSILLEKVVKADLEASVALHPLKVLNNKYVLTYMKKNQAVVQAGESSKASGDISENKFIVEGLQSLTKKKTELEAVEKKNMVKENGVEKMKKERVAVVKTYVVSGSQAGPAKSKSGTNSGEDSRPLAKLCVAKKGGAAPKRKLVLASSDSESTVSFPLVAITNKQRKKRTKLAVTKELPIVVRSKPEQPAQQSLTFSGNMVFGPVEIQEINWETHFLLKIDLATKGKETLEDFAWPNPVEEHCLLVLNSSWKDVSNKMSDYDDWARFRSEYTTDIDNNSEEDEEDFAQGGPQPIKFSRPQADFNVVSELKEVKIVVELDSKIDLVRDTQTYMNHDSAIFRRAFYNKMYEVVTNVNSSHTVLETILVRQFTEHQQQIASDLDFVKIRLAELINHFKEISDVKKGEGPRSKKKRLL
ncbi:hypothetical protein F511_24254 [Dorcoceras hygrometricum]|uniref:Uncharacterized protein n=1 Tax=Dorcoceras hygrometricum TaxID=472368 RepID=A0A2Z7AB86_9LAMI|nr:hypothetical protein F511_24254 [Dorcoceras hygrometricum]